MVNKRFCWWIFVGNPAAWLQVITFSISCHSLSRPLATWPKTSQLFQKLSDKESSKIEVITTPQSLWPTCFHPKRIAWSITYRDGWWMLGDLMDTWWLPVVLDSLSSPAFSHSALAALQLIKSQVPSPTEGPPGGGPTLEQLGFFWLLDVIEKPRSLKVTWEIFTDFLSFHRFEIPTFVRFQLRCYDSSKHIMKPGHTYTLVLVRWRHSPLYFSFRGA